jgi:hypothetical protein
MGLRATLTYHLMALPKVGRKVPATGQSNDNNARGEGLAGQ